VSPAERIGASVRRMEADVIGRRRSDAQLVRGARAGSREAAAELFDRYWTDAWRSAFAITGRRAMADDIAQDAFERAFASLARFDETRPFGAWLHRIVVNRSLDLLRSERRLLGPDAAPPEHELVDGSFFAHAADRALLEAVAALPVARRVVVVLRFGIGLTPQQIAAALDLPVGTVNSRLARALEQLREQQGVEDVR
jgi:RNA polymerase sigma-70 factor, ECF subfamily